MLRPTAPGAVAVRRWVLTGVGYAVPFVVTGGILLTLAYLLGGTGVAGRVGSGPTPDTAGVLARAGYAGLLYLVGTTALALLGPVLAGVTAYAMAGPRALVAGVVGGLLAVGTGAGYLGGLLAGLLAGATVRGLARLRTGPALAGPANVVAVPVVSTLAVGLAVLLLVGPPVAAAQRALTGVLGDLSATGGTLAGLVLGLLVAVDLGGPVNKVAYGLALSALAAGDPHPVAAVTAAGMVPPLAVALASTARPALFDAAERAAGRAGWLLGASFVTEGAVPFAVTDPVRVIPALMAGSGVAGAVAMAGHAASAAPHGGIWAVALVSHPLVWLAAVATGTLTGAAAVVAGRKPRPGSAT